jgi:hypothetical protein
MFELRVDHRLTFASFFLRVRVRVFWAWECFSARIMWSIPAIEIWSYPQDYFQRCLSQSEGRVSSYIWPPLLWTITGGLRTGLAARVCISLGCIWEIGKTLDILRFRTSVVAWSPLLVLASVELESFTL